MGTRGIAAFQVEKPRTSQRPRIFRRRFERPFAVNQGGIKIGFVREQIGEVHQGCDVIRVDVENPPIRDLGGVGLAGLLQRDGV